jgi:putative polyketide hydroxylase
MLFCLAEKKKRSENMATNNSVIIVGGSLNGLSTALLLARRKVPTLVVERHPTTSIQYKFRGISPRSMEIYREARIEAEIRAHRTGDQQAGGIARVKNLADKSVHWETPPWEDVRDLSPTTAATCDQDQLEPILREHAERLGAEVRFNTELVDLRQDDREVKASIRDRGTGKEETVTAAYLVAADGANGNIREMLGIERQGPGVLQHWMNVIFDTDLKPFLEGKRFTACFIMDINGTFVPREGSERWLMAVQYFPERGERPEDFNEAHCTELIRKGAGRSDVKVKLVDARPWEVAALVADQFRQGRVFLVGDTAHVMPPTGGFGGNTGIHDGHNLAWKLAAVLQGVAGAELLDTYDSERRPVAERTLAQALARLQAWFKDPSKKLPPAEKIIDDFAVHFGFLYHHGALIPAEEFSTSEAFEDPRKPTGRPGSRAPHVVVERAGQKLSTIDLFDGQWTLLVGSDGRAWCEAADRTPAASAIDLQSYWIGPGADLKDIDNRWTAAYGVGGDGATLVRPDGFIAWRARGAVAQPAAVLRDVFESLSILNSAGKQRSQSTGQI